MGGAKAGAFIGRYVPGMGGVAGAATGFVIGTSLYVFTDVVEIEGKTVREHIKDGKGANFFWGGFVGLKLATES